MLVLIFLSLSAFMQGRQPAYTEVLPFVHSMDDALKS